MICRTCQQESNPASRMCPFCGNYMGAESPGADVENESLLIDFDERRWTSSQRDARARNGGKPRRKRGKRRSRLVRNNTYQSRMINWVKVGLAAFILVFVLTAGGLIWLQVTQEGQLILARMGRKANAQAYWDLGTEYLDQGYISRSIETYLKAEALEPEMPGMDEKLLMLAEAYEAANQMHMAEDTYKRIYTELAPEKPQAYRLAINIMLDQKRFFEAVSLMQTAYENTGDDGFFNQRSQLVPQPPKASLAAGRHMYSKNVEFISSQDFEIRYTTGDGVLPDTGILYTGPITLNEGTYNFRAVALSNDLVSDEMTIRYIITLPTPLAPKTNMESKTYDRQIRVSLRIVDEDDKDVTLYYTIDGTKPNLDSPRYTGEPILIPPGRSYLRAIAVNRWGKISNEMIVEYKVNKGFKSYFRSEKDQFADFILLKTTLEQFTAKAGAPQGEQTIEDEAVGGAATQLTYPWGEARFYQTEDGMLLYHLQTTLGAHKGPRNTGIGMPIKEVTDKFRDMGQLPNDKGNRGIYFDLANGYARYTVASDDPNTGVLEYVYVGAKDASTTILRYDIVDGRVERILMRYLNRRMSMVEQGG